MVFLKLLAFFKEFFPTLLKAKHVPGERGLGSTRNSEERTVDWWFLRKAIILHLVLESLVQTYEPLFLLIIILWGRDRSSVGLLLLPFMFDYQLHILASYMSSKFFYSIMDIVYTRTIKTDSWFYFPIKRVHPPFAKKLGWPHHFNQELS